MSRETNTLTSEDTGKQSSVFLKYKMFWLTRALTRRHGTWSHTTRQIHGHYGPGQGRGWADRFHTPIQAAAPSEPGGGDGPAKEA